MLPTIYEIEKWTDEKVKHIHHLLFEENVNPQINETREEVDEYMYSVHAEFNRRNLS